MERKFIPLSVPNFTGNEVKYVSDAVASTWVSTAGPLIPKFEKAMAEYMGTDLVVATNSGTSALHLALVDAGIGPGDEVMAINSPESDNAADANYNFELATFCFKSGNSAKAYAAAQKAVELDEALAGKAYMLMGTIWGSQVCPGNEIEKRAQYWVAVDFMVKAKNADESLAEDANNHIRQYSAYFPQTAEAFMYDVTDGQSYTVSCGGMRANTTVRTQK